MKNDTGTAMAVVEDRGDTWRGVHLGPLAAADGTDIMVIGDDSTNGFATLSLTEGQVRELAVKLPDLVEQWTARDRAEMARGSVVIMREAAIYDNKKLDETDVSLIVEAAAKLGYVEKTARLYWLAFPAGDFMVSIERSGVGRVGTEPAPGDSLMPTEPGTNGVWQVVLAVREILKGLR